MKILLIGASGTIGKILEPALAKNHEIISAGRNSGAFRIDLSDSNSIEKLFSEIKNIDACIRWRLLHRRFTFA
jgi:dTDP-4-dehydrorhamnose reductase